jgi:ComF family protein
MALCGSCVERFAPPLARCARCGQRCAAPVTACGACIAEPPPFEACIVACDYAFPWDRLVSDFKFNGRVELADALALRLVQAVQAATVRLPDLLVPVPLAPRRLAERGYNQAWELARRVARGLGQAADAQLLERPIDRAHQAELPRSARLTNLRGAFFVAPQRRATLQGRHVALVDDVMTTGTTLSEAAATLRRAGAGRVDAWVLARTPAPGQ